MRLVHHSISDRFPNLILGLPIVYSNDCCWNHHRNHWLGLLYGRLAMVDAFG